MVAEDAKAMMVYVAHTTCALTTAARAGVSGEFDHRPSVIVPVSDGSLVLGTWQRIILVELDGPRERQLAVVNL